MNKRFLLALPIAAAFSSPALAQDAGPLGGFRIEAVAGYDNFRAEFEEDAGRDNRGGVIGGVGVGFDFPFGAALALGADAEITLATTDIDIDDGEVSAKRDLYVGGRLTAGLSERLSLVGKVGYTNARVRFRSEDEDAEFSAAGNLDGVRGAAGVQISTDTRAYYGFEYRYSNYEADVERHQGVITIGYRF
jgi:outer membrane immunogenic protein